MSLTVAVAIGVALALEYAVGEPPTRVHPVAWLGRAIAPLDADWTRPGPVGTVAAIGVPFLAAAVVVALTAAATIVSSLVGAVVAGTALFTTTSLRMLIDEAHGTVVASERDPAAARDRLPALVGREPSALSPPEIRSAAVESAAENLADGLVAPLFAFAVVAPVSLPLAAGAAAAVKAVNTMDSMLGYPHKPVGRASARLDDLVMWLPARLSAALLAVAAVDPDALLAARRWAGEPESPNSGWPMATMAGALHARLAKPGAYVLNPVASLPTVEAAERGIRLVGRAGLLAYLFAAILVLALGGVGWR